MTWFKINSKWLMVDG